MSAHEWIESDWPDDPEPMCKWCRLGKATIGDDECVGPSVEQMIEAMGDVRVFRVPSGWSATEPGSHKYHYGDTPREAFAALYRAWRERE